MKKTLEQIYNDDTILKPSLLKADINGNIEYFLLQAPLQTNKWYIGLSMIVTPNGGYRSQGVTSIYRGNEEIWEIV